MRMKNAVRQKNILDFMEHFICVMVEELGEIARARKEFLRDKQKFDAQTLRHELVDLFVYLMQGSMALNMDLEKEYKKKMRTFKTRFQAKNKQVSA
jgi:NTP pyrophosphatase (non-canonical NTP hydrolase)